VANEYSAVIRGKLQNHQVVDAFQGYGFGTLKVHACLAA
jgi:hypothetical protein